MNRKFVIVNSSPLVMVATDSITRITSSRGTITIQTNDGGAPIHIDYDPAVFKRLIGQISEGAAVIDTKPMPEQLAPPDYGDFYTVDNDLVFEAGDGYQSLWAYPEEYAIALFKRWHTEKNREYKSIQYGVTEI